jgi:hypothetical protein
MKRIKKLISKIRSYFTKKKTPKVWQLEEGHVVVPAFMDRGVQYYEIKDVFNSFANRGLMALQVYEEWDMRLKKEDLLDFILAFEKVLNTPKELNVMNLVKIVTMLKERVAFPIATQDIYYKFASVRYFDENESPYAYDPDYNKIKIARWKEASSEVDDFFILQRLGDMLPLPKLSKEDLPNYLAMVQKVSDYQLQIIQQLNSPQQTSEGSYKG